MLGHFGMRGGGGDEKGPCNPLRNHLLQCTGVCTGTWLQCTVRAWPSKFKLHVTTSDHIKEGDGIKRLPKSKQKARILLPVALIPCTTPSLHVCSRSTPPGAKSPNRFTEMLQFTFSRITWRQHLALPGYRMSP